MTKRLEKTKSDASLSKYLGLLLKYQHMLGLRPQEVMLMLHLLDIWEGGEIWPDPSKLQLAKRLRVNRKQVQRYAVGLESRGLIQRIQRYGAAHHEWKLTNEYDLSGFFSEMDYLEQQVHIDYFNEDGKLI